jgi:prevent-host-death family protein
MNTKERRNYPLSEHGATIALREAKAQFSALVERAAAGEEIVITWHGRPRARLLPLAEERGILRVDRKWLDTMRVGGSKTPAETLVRDDRDNRG